MIKTYTADLSICSQICRLAVQEAGLLEAQDVEVDIEYAMDNFEPWFVRLQPAMTVPVMDYGGTLIQDSKEILYFLAEQHPEADLYPKRQRDDIDAFIDGFYENFLFVGVFSFGHLQSRSDELRDFILMGKTDVTLKKLRALAENPEFAEVAAGKLAQVEQRDFSRLADPGLLGSADERVRGMLSQLDERLAHGRAFACGPGYTLADVVATALLARVHFIMGTDPDWFSPLLKGYWERMQERASFSAANVCATWESTLMSKQFEAHLATVKQP